MLTVVVSREEEANHGLLDFIISNKIEQVDGNLNVTCKLSHTHDDLTVYQIQLERNREHVSSHFHLSLLTFQFSVASAYSPLPTTVSMPSPMNFPCFAGSSSCINASSYKSLIEFPRFS